MGVGMGVLTGVGTVPGGGIVLPGGKPPVPPGGMDDPPLPPPGEFAVPCDDAGFGGRFWLTDGGRSEYAFEMPVLRFVRYCCAAVLPLITAGLFAGALSGGNAGMLLANVLRVD